MTALSTRYPMLMRQTWSVAKIWLMVRDTQPRPGYKMAYTLAGVDGSAGEKLCSRGWLLCPIGWEGGDEVAGRERRSVVGCPHYACRSHFDRSHSANVVMGNLRVVQNIEARAVAKSSALSAMQEAIMTSGFLQGEKAFVVSCQGDNYARCFDMTGDQIADEMRVTLSKPKCISAIPVRNASLKVWQNPDDASCYQPGVYSLCADALWEVTMAAEDPITPARQLIAPAVNAARMPREPKR